MFQNFLIVGTQRTGSTALFRALNFHPDIACGNEWTQNVAAHKKFNVTEHALAGDFSVLTRRQQMLIGNVFHPGTRWLGFKILFRSSDKWLFHPRNAPALWFDRFESYIQWLRQRPSVHVIHIVRNDPIEWLKSKYLSDKARAWSVRTYPDNIKIEVPIREALRRLSAKNWVDRRLSHLKSTNPYLYVSYEEFLKSDHAVVMGLLDFLKCDPARIGAFEYRKHTKQSQLPASEYISNFRQLLAALSQQGNMQDNQV